MVEIITPTPLFEKKNKKGAHEPELSGADQDSSNQELSLRVKLSVIGSLAGLLWIPILAALQYFGIV